ncbi:MAG: PhnA domain-containing protein [Cyclobacteriaceae bacterium]|nr:PhnA domain-containing protein [Cyclobacteriaceae bacterium]
MRIKVKNMRLTDKGHTIYCKIAGFDTMALKSEFIKKASFNINTTQKSS